MPLTQNIKNLRICDLYHRFKFRKSYPNILLLSFTALFNKMDQEDKQNQIQRPQLEALLRVIRAEKEEDMPIAGKR